MIEAEGEKFIREKLGLPAVETKPATAVSATGKIVEPCQADKPAELKAPAVKTQ